MSLGGGNGRKEAYRLTTVVYLSFQDELDIHITAQNARRLTQNYKAVSDYRSIGVSWVLTCPCPLVRTEQRVASRPSCVPP